MDEAELRVEFPPEGFLKRLVLGRILHQLVVLDNLVVTLLEQHHARLSSIVNLESLHL